MGRPGLARHPTLFDLGPTNMIQGGKRSRLYCVLDFVSLQVFDSRINIRSFIVFYMKSCRVTLLEARLKEVGV